MGELGRGALVERDELVDRGGEQKLGLTDLRTAHEGFFPALMNA